MNKLILVIMIALGFSVNALAHEGHNKTPGAVQAPHGGIMQGTTQLYIELVNDASGIKLYPMTHELKPLALDALTILGTAQAPKKPKVPVKFNKVEDHFEAKVSIKGAYRYTLELSTKYGGKKEKLTFQVEPPQG